MKPELICTAVLLSAAIASSQVYGQEASKWDLAKAAQNPLAGMINLPSQNDTDFGIGPGDDTEKSYDLK